MPPLPHKLTFCALFVKTNQAEYQASLSATLAKLSLPRKEGKEVLVSTGLIKLWDLKGQNLLDQTATLEFILSGGLIPGFASRTVTEPVDYKIVGIFENDKQAMVYVPLSDFESMGVAKYTLAKVLAKDTPALAKVREQIEAMGFYTRSLADTLAQVERLFRVMRFLLGSFGMIAFIVALFGMFNTLTVSLLERTREIGVMKTFGTTDTDVIRLLLVESSLMGIMGGLLGIVFGISVGYLINILSMLLKQDTAVTLFQFPFGFLILVFLLACSVGLLTGIYPAQRAKKISALNALRYE